jgi:DNA repair exonuclease SbcCD ATPase subunit
MKQREINANLESARTNLKNLKYKYEQDRNELDEKKIRLQKLRNQTKMVQELADRHQKEHAELEKYIQEIGEKARKNSDTANHLLGEYRKLQNGKLISIFHYL